MIIIPKLLLAMFYGAVGMLLGAAGASFLLLLIDGISGGALLMDGLAEWITLVVAGTAGLLGGVGSILSDPIARAALGFKRASGEDRQSDRANSK